MEPVRKTDDLLNSFLRKKQEERQASRTPYPDDVWAASSAGKCVRQLWFQKKDPKEPDDALLRIFAVGEILHEWFQENIYNKGTAEERVILSDRGILIRGRYDYEDEHEVVDFKTCSRLPPKGDAKKHHKYQMAIYLKALGRSKGKITYIQKNDLKVDDRVVEYSDDLYEKAVANFLEATECLKNGFIPARLAKTEDEPGYPSNWECRYCDWRKECDKIE